MVDHDFGVGASSVGARDDSVSFVEVPVCKSAAGASLGFAVESLSNFDSARIVKVSGDGNVVWEGGSRGKEGVTSPGLAGGGRGRNMGGAEDVAGNGMGRGRRKAGSGRRRKGGGGERERIRGERNNWSRAGEGGGRRERGDWGGVTCSAGYTAVGSSTGHFAGGSGTTGDRGDCTTRGSTALGCSNPSRQGGAKWEVVGRRGDRGRRMRLHEAGNRVVRGMDVSGWRGKRAGARRGGEERTPPGSGASVVKEEEVIFGIERGRGKGARGAGRA